MREPAPMLVVVEDGAPRTITVSARRDGHFLLETMLGGERTPMLVDTGASIISLRASDARKAGIYLTERDYSVPFSTANGTVLGAVTTLDELRIGGIVLRDLRVSVLPDDKLRTSLFGVNGLNRFARRESTSQKLVLYTD